MLRKTPVDSDKERSRRTNQRIAATKVIAMKNIKYHFGVLHQYGKTHISVKEVKSYLWDPAVWTVAGPLQDAFYHKYPKH